MELPKRVRQHVNESESYAILLYKLRKMGVFRNLTENDYGIDFEIELVNGEEVTGKYIKVQVKSSEDLTIRKTDNVPTVGGIKQSTLFYWTELSLSTHVLIFAVDLSTELIYMTKPIFWQATKLLDGSDKSKTIQFLPGVEDQKLNPGVVGALAFVYSHFPPVIEILSTLRKINRNIKKYVEMVLDFFHYDSHMEVAEPEMAKEFLEDCKILLFDINRDSQMFSDEDKKYLLSYEYWARKSGEHYEELTNYVAQKPFLFLIQKIISSLKWYKRTMLEGKYYWKTKNRPLLKLIYSTYLPEKTERQDLISWVEGNEESISDFEIFIRT